MSSFSEFEITAYRSPDYPIDNIFFERWSPRSMSAAEVSEEQLMTLFEAARWAPSCFNAQPWRFLYAKRDTQHWPDFFNLLDEFNQLWCANAAALVVLTSVTTFEWGEQNPTHAFDAGAAWQNLALQGLEMGLVVHGMAGFDYERAAKVLNVPAGQQIQAMIAIGVPGRTAELPAELQKEEVPSGRNLLADLVHEGGYANQTS